MTIFVKIRIITGEILFLYFQCKKMESKKKIRRLKYRYRLVVYNDSTYHTVWSAKLTRFKMFGVVILFVASVITVTTILVAFTSIRELIPGYPSEAVREMTVKNAILTDSLAQQIKLRDDYFEQIRTIIRGEVIEDDYEMLDTFIHPSTIEHHLYSHDSIFAQSLLEERLDLSVRMGEGNEINLDNIHFFTPLQGMISGKFDKLINHYGIDIVGLPNSRISAVLSGTVIFSAWTLDTGYVIYIQHDNNFISAYKHNSEVLKKMGEQVEAGEVIAFMGNSGEYTTGPHLHFELWFRGIPLDPQQYIDF